MYKIKLTCVFVLIIPIPISVRKVIEISSKSHRNLIEESSKFNRNHRNLIEKSSSCNRNLIELSKFYRDL